MGKVEDHGFKLLWHFPHFPDRFVFGQSNAEISRRNLFKCLVETLNGADNPLSHKQCNYNSQQNAADCENKNGYMADPGICASNAELI